MPDPQKCRKKSLRKLSILSRATEVNCFCGCDSITIFWYVLDNCSLLCHLEFIPKMNFKRHTCSFLVSHCLAKVVSHFSRGVASKLTGPKVETSTQNSPLCKSTVSLRSLCMRLGHSDLDRAVVEATSALNN